MDRIGYTLVVLFFYLSSMSSFSTNYAIYINEDTFHKRIEKSMIDNNAPQLDIVQKTYPCIRQAVAEDQSPVDCHIPFTIVDDGRSQREKCPPLACILVVFNDQSTSEWTTLFKTVESHLHTETNQFLSNLLWLQEGHSMNKLCLLIQWTSHTHRHRCIGFQKYHAISQIKFLQLYQELEKKNFNYSNCRHMMITYHFFEIDRKNWRTVVRLEMHTNEFNFDPYTLILGGILLSVDPCCSVAHGKSF